MIHTQQGESTSILPSSGAENVEPNATNLKHTFTLDIGGISTNQEYAVTY